MLLPLRLNLETTNKTLQAEKGTFVLTGKDIRLRKKARPKDIRLTRRGLKYP
jgi:hypothetical protein